MGINIVPAQRDAAGNVVESVVDQIMPLLQGCAKWPEVTWMRDGEAL